MKRFNFTLFCALVLLCASVTNGHAQKQIIGTFPYMEGGFENQAAGNLGGNTPLSTTWTKGSALATSTITTTGGRSGPNYVAINVLTTASTALQSPQPTDPAAGPAASTTYTVQLYTRNTNATTAGTAFQFGITTNGTGTANDIKLSAAGTINANTTTWSRQIFTIATAGDLVASAGVGLVKLKGRVEIDDFVIYPGSEDITAPGAPTAPGTSNVSSSSVTVGWTAPGGGVDGGGYLVIRYSTDLTGAATPNIGGIYTVGNTIGNGAVAYIGTATSFVDNNVSTNTHYYYVIYAVDKAFNYSTSATTDLTISGGGLGTPSATSLSFANTALTTNSAEQSFSISGSDLTDMSITAPTGFLVSIVSGGPYAGSVSITPAGGAVNSTIYAVFDPVTPGSKSDNIVISSTGFSSVNVAVTGYGAAMYRSKQSGDWSDAASWQYFNGTTWIDATTTPTNNDASTNIQSGHTITVSSALSVSQVTIDGNLTTILPNTLTIVHGTASKDLVVDNGGVLLNQGAISIGSSATWEIQNGATYIDNTNNTSTTPVLALLAAMTIDNGSTFVFQNPVFSTPLTLPGTTFYNFSLQSSAGAFTLTTSGSFTVNGKLAVGASVTHTNNSTTTLNGDLDVNGTLNTNGFSLAANKTLAVYPGGVLIIKAGQTITPGSGTFLILSDATGTGSIGSSDNGQINGNVTVQRYVPAHSVRAYTLVASPVNSPTIYNSWQEAGAFTPGYGTQISGASAGSNGFDFVSAAGIPSIYTYNDNNLSGSKWVGLTNTNANTLGVGVGYLLFIRGDRTVGAGSGPLAATTLRATGTLLIGTLNFIASGGTHVGPTGTTASTTLLSGVNLYNLVANPYACAIKWSTLNKGNLTGSFTVYDPNLQSFVTVDGTTVSPNTSQQQADVIQSGQAFFIQNDGTGNLPAITMKETDKTITAATGTGNTVFGMDAPAAQLNINVYKATNAFADGIVAVFNNNYSRNKDAKDAAKFTNFGETISFSENNDSLSIDARPSPQASDTLFINMKQMVANATYTMVIDGTGFNSNNLQTATLIDKVTGTSTVLDLSAKTSYGFTTTAASETGRLFIVLNGKPVVTTPPPAADSSSINSALQVTLLGNPVKDQVVLNYIAKQSGNTTIRVLGTNGQTMTSLSLGVQQQGNVIIPVAQYAAGLYFIEVKVGGNTVITKVVKN